MDVDHHSYVLITFLATGTQVIVGFCWGVFFRGDISICICVWFIKVRLDNAFVNVWKKIGKIELSFCFKSVISILYYW